MRITPLDVRKQEFRKVVRGLDADEVYAFLTTVADEYEGCLSDNKQLREKVIDLDEKVSEYRNMETTLRDTLLTAERVMSEARQNARKEAELILRDATIKASGQTAHIAAEVEALKNQLRELRGQRDSFLARLQSLAESQVGLVESFRSDFKNEDAERSAHRIASFSQAPEIGIDTEPTPQADTEPTAPVAELPAVEPNLAPEPPAISQISTVNEEPVPVAAPAAAPVDNTPDQWRGYEVGEASTDSALAQAVDTMTVTVPESAYAQDVVEFEVEVEVALEDDFSEVSVTQPAPAPPIETQVDALPTAGSDPSEEDPVDRIARMMTEASAYEEHAAASGQDESAVASSAAPVDGEFGPTEEEGEESSRWSLSRFTKGLANF
jgi:cell division initiation protein